MIRIQVLMLMAMLAVSLVPAAGAVTTWDLSAYGGYSRSFQDDGTDGSYGIRLSAFAMVRPTIGIGVEGARIELGSADIDSVVQPGTSFPTRGEASIGSWVITGGAKWQPRAGDWRPFVIGGAGLYPVSYEIKLQNGFRDDIKRSKFGFHLGAGLAWVPGGDSPIAIGIDARWNSVPKGRITREQLAEEIETGVKGEGSTLNYGTIFFGVTYNTSNTP